MKIKKDFIPLILNGTKRYEFRNSNDKSGLYKIRNKYFLLYKHFDFITFEKENVIKTIKKNVFIDKHSLQWIKKNIEYFNVGDECDMYLVVIYKWIRINIKKVKDIVEVE